MTDHWQVIESALRERHERLLSTLDRWQEGSVIYERRLTEANVIDAALAFVREQRSTPQGRWMPVEDGIVFHETDSILAEWNYPAYSESIAFLEVRKNGHAIACGSMPKEDEQEVDLPFQVRLCRWQEGE
jgi:hypothetical protein